MERVLWIIGVVAMYLIGSTQGYGQQTGKDSALELAVQTGHSVPVHGVLFSPIVDWKTLGFPSRKGSGEIVATGSNDGTVRIWDMATLREVRSLPLASGSSIGAIALSPDGKLVAAAGSHLVKVWEIATGREILAFQDGPSYGRSAAFSGDGTKLAVGDQTFARVWNIADPHNAMTAPDPAEKIAFGPGDILAVAGHDPIPEGKSIDPSIPYRAAVWDVGRGVRVGAFSGKGYYVLSLAVLEDGSISALGADGKCNAVDGCTTVIRRSLDGTEIADLRGPPWYPTASAFCPDSRFFAAGSNDGRVILWDVERQKAVYEGATPGEFMEGISCSHDQMRLASGESRGRVAIWERNQNAPTHILEGVANEIEGIVSDPSSTHLFLLGRGTSFQYGYTETVLRWDIPTLRAPTYLSDASSPLAMSDDGRWTAIGHEKQTVVIYREENRFVDTETPSQGTAVAFDAAGERFAAAFNGTINVWRTSPWQQEAHVDAWTNLRIETVAFSRDGDILASAGGEGYVILWDLPSMRQRCTLGDKKGPQDTVWTVAFSPDRKTLASAGNDREIQLWDIATCKLVGNLVGSGSAIKQISFSSDGEFLASAGWDGTVRLWTVKQRQQKNLLSGHGWLVDSVRFIASDKIVISGGQDGTARLWDVDEGRELASVVTFRDGQNWLVATPEGYFDSTATAAEKIFWRVDGTNNLVPLSRYYTDFFYPGLLTEILEGKRPVPEIDIATALGIPSLRTMLSSDALAHVEKRGNQVLICLAVPPGIALDANVASENLARRRYLPRHLYELQVVPEDPTCKNQIDLGEFTESQRTKLLQIVNAPRREFSTPWDRLESDVSQSVLHVVAVGINNYNLASSGFDPLSFPKPSVKSIMKYFNDWGADARPFKKIEIWPVLLNEEAKTETIRNELHEIATNTRSDDVVIIYLAGHGQVNLEDEMFYFVSADSNSERLSSTGLSTAIMADALREMNARRIVVLVDTCQAGGSIEALQRLAQTRASIEMARQTSEPGYRSKGIGIYVVAATMPLSFAISFAIGNNESAFSSALLNALKPGPTPKGIRDIIKELQTTLPGFSSKIISDFHQTPLVALVGLDFPISESAK
jgi:WD40 repeat protein